MAKLHLQQDWGNPLNMSALGYDFWSPAMPSMVLMHGTNNRGTFAIAGDPRFDSLTMDYAYNSSTGMVTISAIDYKKGGSVVLTLLDIDVSIHINGLKNNSWNVVFANPGNDEIYGFTRNDLLTGGTGDDFLVGWAGNDTIFGGDGNDTAAYNGLPANYRFTKNADGSVLVTDKLGLWGSDTVWGVETFQFYQDGNSIYLSHDELPAEPPPPPLDPFAGSNTVRGNGGNNTLKGYGGNDKIYGNAGNDKLYGGDGNDYLSGGKGKDSFVFDFQPHAKTNVDKIADFKVVDDTIRLDNAVFTKIGGNGSLKASAFWSNNSGKAHDKNDRVIYEKDTGKIYYDADGTGKTAGLHFATLGKKLALTEKDFFVI